MKTLKGCIIESLLDDEDDVFNGAKEGVISIIKEFLEINYKIRGSYTIKEVKGRFIVDVKGDIRVKNNNITSLTNELFEFGVVSGFFTCVECELLKTLKGAPKEVGGYFGCSYCSSLTSLEGAPKKIGEGFYCYNCISLKTLEGAPKKIKTHFACDHCDLLTSLEGAPKEVGGWFDCGYCKSLKTLKGAPKKVGEDFYCNNCDIQFTEDDVKKYVNDVKKIIL